MAEQQMAINRLMAAKIKWDGFVDGGLVLASLTM